MVRPSTPKLKITVDSTELQSDTLSCDVVLEENAVSGARLVANDYKSKTFLGKVNLRDEIKIYMDYSNASTQVFGGYVTKLIPSLDMSGEIVGIEALGYGEALINMRCAEQYGSDSENSSLNTLREIITDSTKGIVPNWVEKVLGTATSSGYTLYEWYVQDITSDFAYLYFPFKPALNCIQDLCDLVTAANGTGAHFIVTVDKKLCLGTVGNHEAGLANDWPTWFNTDQAGSTIEVAKDMIVSQFVQQEAEANYIIYAGAFRKPASEIWTESTTGWDTSTWPTVSTESTIVKIGNNSVKVNMPADKSGSAWYPNTTDLGLDVTAFGGKYSVPYLSFWLYRDSDIYIDQITIRMETSSGNDYSAAVDAPTDANEWQYYSIPIGPYWRTEDATAFKFAWIKNGAGVWTQINDILFYFSTLGLGECNLYIDGLAINGYVIRGAYDSTLIASDKCKIRLIVDSVPKDDSGKAADDSGMMAQLAKAELLRARTKPITGQIVIPGDERILAGQKCHIHFGKKSDGTFRIDKDFRIMKHRLHFGLDGFKSYLTLTDDLTNSSPRRFLDNYNMLLEATRPGFQTRERGSLKGKEIDITATILSKDYPS